MKTWRGGMIGAGAWSDIQLTAWAAVENAEIVAVCDRQPELAARNAEKFGIPHVYADAATMLQEAELDFVDICTRPYSHAALTRLAADAGLPVLCQKPFCESLAEAGEVAAYCRQKNVPLMVNENFRWQAWYRKVKEMLDADAIGEPFVANIHWRLRVTLPHFHHRQPYFKDMPRLAVYELGVHYLDVFRYLFGDPATIYARLHQMSGEIAGEDVQIINLGYNDRPLTCLINHSWASVAIPQQDSIEEQTPLDIAHPLEIDGTKGTIHLKADRSLHLITDDEHQIWEYPAEARPAAHAATQQHFIDCIEQDLPFETSAADYIHTMALVYACYQSNQEGRVIHLDEILKRKLST